MKIYTLGHNILKLSSISAKFPFATSKTLVDIKYKKILYTSSLTNSRTTLGF